ncbi:MAG: hypothetical protein ACWA47_13470 [Brevirhabdus sp.]
MKMTGLGLVAALALATAAPVVAQEATTTEPPAEVATTEGLTIAGVRVGNPFDASTWWDGSEGHHDVETASLDVDFVDPEFWFSFFDAETHSRNHMALMNPATWGQFMHPATYVKMADVTTWMKWVDLDSYEPILDIQNYAYWMQPGAYEHMVKVDHYAQLADLGNYGTMFTEAFGYMLPKE